MTEPEDTEPRGEEIPLIDGGELSIIPFEPGNYQLTIHKPGATLTVPLSASDVWNLRQATGRLVKEWPAIDWLKRDAPVDKWIA